MYYVPALAGSSGDMASGTHVSNPQGFDETLLCKQCNAPRLPMPMKYNRHFL